jgi:hypothetical protein
LPTFAAEVQIQTFAGFHVGVILKYSHPLADHKSKGAYHIGP